MGLDARLKKLEALTPDDSVPWAAEADLDTGALVRLFFRRGPEEPPAGMQAGALPATTKLYGFDVRAVVAGEGP